MTNSNRFRAHTAFARVVSSVLLILVIYGTTIEAAHRHGRVSLTNKPSTTASVVHTQSGVRGADGSVGCGECLICQLHQQFSTSLVTIREDSPKLQTRLETSQPAAAIFQTRSVTTQTGRGPPLAN